MQKLSLEILLPCLENKTQLVLEQLIVSFEKM